jgi:hypothetical protein
MNTIESGMANFNIYKRPVLAGWLIFIACALYYVSFCRYGLNLWDEGGIYVGGLRYLDGQKVFVDFYGYPPGRYWMVEAMFRLFGFQMLPVRYLYAVGTALFGVAAFQIARRFMPPVYVVFAVLLVVSAPAVYYQRFYGLMFLFNAWAAIVFFENRRNWPWVVAAGVATYLFKAEVVLIAAPVYAYILLSQFGFGKKGWLALAAAAAVFALALLHNDLMKFIIFRIQVERQLWGNPFPLPWAGYQGAEFGLFPFLENMLFYLPLFSACLLAGMAWREKNGKLATLAYLQGAAMSLVVTRAGFDNLIRCLPLFFIVAVYLAFRLSAARGFAAARVAALASLVVVWVFYMADFNVKNGFYVGSIGAVREVDTMIGRGRAQGVVASAEDAAVVGRVTDWIQLAVKPNEPIFAIPLNPIWYYLSGRKNPTAYDWVLPGIFRETRDEQQLVSRLDVVRPPLIIIVDIPIDGREERRLAGYAPNLVNWVVTRYRYSGRVGYFQMWSKPR